jgi:trimethylamine--corrinoid protein Co-methyltransferase
MRLEFQLLGESELGAIHEGSLAVLEKTGMHLESEPMLEALRRHGAAVDAGARVARFPPRLVEEALASNRALLASGRKMHLLNGVTSGLTEGGRIQAKLSGGCEKYLDPESLQVRQADESSLLRFVRLGESLSEVDFVGNPIVLARDAEGRPIEERLRRIRTAALIAKNTRKLGSVEVWSEKEIDFLVEMGSIARGSREEFARRPCFVTAKETISPLFLDANAASILLALGRRSLPCTIIPMPLSGLSSPVTRMGNAIMANAEVLGVITAVKAVHPESLPGGGSISGVLDMGTGVVSFSSPEAILQDIAVAEVHERLYGFDYLIGTGYTDANHPNPQVLAEKLMKFLLSFLSRRCSYPVGLLGSGAVFSDLQALVDLELCRYIHAHFAGFGDAAAVPELVGLIAGAGIRGSFLSEEHTLAHFRENWLPGVFDPGAQAGSVYDRARERLHEVYARKDFWQLDARASREIDAVVRSAERVL